MRGARKGRLYLGSTGALTPAFEIGRRGFDWWMAQEQSYARRGQLPKPYCAMALILNAHRAPHSFYLRLFQHHWDRTVITGHRVGAAL